MKYTLGEFPMIVDISVYPHSHVVYCPYPVSLSNQGWFIPTHVGYTSSTLAGGFPFAVHPHSRGVYCCGIENPSSACGSSPLAWGIRHITYKRVFIISVHPHSRGVYGTMPPPCHRPDGSSPLAWGIRIEEKHLRPDYRFIPTRVGYT